jgi:hypothetical protein
VQNWLKTRPEAFFLTELKKTCETLEQVGWSRGDGGVGWDGRLHLKVILVSFLYIYNKCAFFFQKTHYFLTYPRILII